MSNLPEVWLRGETTSGLSPYLQPAANALLQAREEITAMLGNFPENLLWEKPAGAAAVGFHLKHITGVLDRLLTYAENKALTEMQLEYLKNEAVDTGETTAVLLADVKNAITRTIERYRNFSVDQLTDFRGVGRQQLPSTVIGLCFHAAEHTMRHTGQLLVVVKVIKGQLCS